MNLDFPVGSCLDSPAHAAWLRQEGRRLLDFAKASRLPEGFGSLDAEGRLALGASAQTLNTARMTHCFAIAHMQGEPGCLAYAEHGVAALLGPLRDHEHDGWFGHPYGHNDDAKLAYLHAFVALAASSAAVAGVAGARQLLGDVVRVIEGHFWCEAQGALDESFSRTWQLPEPYRGANSNMHATEAFLALADATGDPLWLQRALRIAERIIHVHATASGYRVIEHFDASWQPLLHYNQAQPADLFRPYGTTPGHALEWARLLLHLEASLRLAGQGAPDWLLECACGLFDSACRQAWSVDGEPGFVYTLDWDNRPVVRQRLHWVHAEACATAAALWRRTAEARYQQWYQCFWAFIDKHFIDRDRGSWHHELDASNNPAGTLWPGKPDLYHAYQALLLPNLPLAPSLATAVSHYVTKR